MKRVVDLALTRATDVTISNSKVDRKIVDQIKSAFDYDLMRYPVGYATGNGVILTDGNHRVTAMIELGMNFIPFVPLTKAEYDHVAFSDTNTVDLDVRVPETLEVMR